ncbi:MAG: helix-hairpin-helix domain-containing protein [Ignavibacteriaceae bacterium]|nr:helix-hairpin-helix domain-containing protein [Ignavibacteriaceae bacterium]
MLPVKKEIVKHLNEIADMMEFNNENIFKVKAFRNGANSIRGYDGDIMVLIAEERLSDIKGIGKGIQPVILDFVASGNSKLHAELMSGLPKGITELFSIKGIGPKKAAQLYYELQITDRSSLALAAENNLIAGLQGFGTKTEEKIREELQKITENEKFCLIDKGFSLLSELETKISGINGVSKISYTGEARRINEIFSVLEFVILADSAEHVQKESARFITDSTLTESVIEGYYMALQVKIYITSSGDEFYSTLFKTTGSTEFLSAISYAGQSSDSEEKIFKDLGFPYIAPENRESEFIESQWIKDYKLPELNPTDFKGHFHFHTSYSDGFNSVAEMVENAKQAGYDYSVVCDHSQSAFYAGGLTPAKIEKQLEEIERVRDSGSRVFQGIESDILADGSLDYPEEIMKNFTLVVASIHSRLNLTEEEMTARIIKAIENPYTDILAHPSGRILLKRDPYPVNLFKVIDACAANDVALEINANPKRLDTDWRYLFYAREKGVKFAINADAHSADQIAFVNFGIMTARKAGITAGEVINCYSFDQFRQFASRKVSRRL